MKLITAIVRPHVVEPIRERLDAIGLHGMTISEVQGFGRQSGHTEIYRGAEYQVNFLPKMKVEVVVGDDLVDETVDEIVATAWSGAIGDGKIWITEVIDVIRVRTKERGADAV
ncbi:MAG: P-II family nitrogen regulator [Ferrimicrobium sp.]